MRSERFPVGSGELEPGEDRLGETLAAAAGEGEGVDQRRAELLLHLLLNLAAGAVQACLHRLRLDAEELRRLLNAHAFDEPHDQTVRKASGRASMARSKSARISRWAIVVSG